ncbi:MAG: acyltransferase 3 [Rubritepida sp.]|nr:acyltransferase 3 [Rubritepida sp.]
MKPATSCYLDLLRISAAIVVLLSHYMPSLYGWHENWITGHDAVIVFFVLSGFVVAYAAEFRDKNIGTYAISRLSRLWSVGIPSLLIGLIVAGLGSNGGYDFWLNTVFSVLLNLFFLGEGWNWEIFAPGNGPYWSINYEAWYYIIFGIAFYLRTPYRTPLLILALVLAGPKIVLLLPIWLAGVVLFRYRHILVVSPGTASFMLISSIIAFAYVSSTQLTVWSREWLRDLTGGYSYLLGPSTSILGDYLLLPIICMNIVAANNLGGIVGAAFEKLRTTIAFISSFTLSVYLFHMPLHYLFADVFSKYLHRTLPPNLIFFLCIVGIVSIGFLTEHKRHWLRTWMASNRVYRSIEATIRVMASDKREAASIGWESRRKQK